MILTDLPNEVLLIIIGFVGRLHGNHGKGLSSGGSLTVSCPQTRYTGQLSNQLESLYSSIRNITNNLSGLFYSNYTYEPLVGSLTDETNILTHDSYRRGSTSSRFNHNEVGYYSRKSELVRLSSTCRKLRSLIAGMLFKDISVMRIYYATKTETGSNKDEWLKLSQLTVELISLIESRCNDVTLFSLSIKCLEIVNLQNDFLSKIIRCCPNICNLKVYGPSLLSPLPKGDISSPALNLKSLTLKLPKYEVMSSLITAFFLPGISRLELLIDPQELAVNFSQSFEMIRLPNLRQLVVCQADGFPGIWKPVCDFIGTNSSNLEFLSCRSIRSTTSSTRAYALVNPELIYQSLEEFFHIASSLKQLKCLQLDLRTLFNYDIKTFNIDLSVPHLELIESAIICPFTNEQTNKLLSILPRFTCLQKLSLVYGTHSERVTHNTVIVSLEHLVYRLRHSSLNSLTILQAWNLIEATRPVWMKQADGNYGPHYLQAETFEVMPDFTLSPSSRYSYEEFSSMNNENGFEVQYKDTSPLFWSVEASLNQLVRFQYKEPLDEKIKNLKVMNMDPVSDNDVDSIRHNSVSQSFKNLEISTQPSSVTSLAQSEKERLIQLILGTKHSSYRGLRA